MRYKIKVRRAEAALGWTVTIPGVDAGILVHDLTRPKAVRRAQAEALRLIADRVQVGQTGPGEEAVLLNCFVVRDEDEER